MIDFLNFRSLEEGLADTLQHAEGLHKLASLTQTEIKHLSETIAEEDWYRDMPLIKTSVREIWKIQTPVLFIEHSIWCAHREATWLMKRGKFEDSDLAYHFFQPEHLIQTHNKPTIIISPMTLGTYDALHIVLTALKHFQPQRKVVIYGEQMESYLELHPEHEQLFATDTLSGIKQILQTLDSGGLFLTYPDFVYQKHAVTEGKLFGMLRSFSSSFLKIALKSKAELLPITVIRSNEALHARFYSPISPDKTGDDALLSDSIRIQLQCLLVSKILEGLIVQVPNQWRLLPTLTHESVDMA